MRSINKVLCSLLFPSVCLGEVHLPVGFRPVEDEEQRVGLQNYSTGNQLVEKESTFSSSTTSPVHIGEDCRDPNTSCAYFRPQQFLSHQPSFIKEVAGRWNAESVDDLCSRFDAWAIELYNIDCDEDWLEEGTKYCRPREGEVMPGIKNKNLTPETDPFWFFPPNFTFKHVRKTGGNSFLRAMWKIEKNRYPLYKIERVRSSIEGSAAATMAAERMDKILYDQQNGHSHSLLLAVRNPVSRFVSLVSQIMYDDADVRNACESESNTEILRGVLRMVPDMLNIHVLPMFGDIFCNVMGRDVEVTVYNFEDFPKVLKVLGADPEEKKNENQFTLSTFDLDQDTIKKVCSLYAWDVAMMEYIGFKVPECTLQ